MEKQHSASRMRHRFWKKHQSVIVIGLGLMMTGCTASEASNVQSGFHYFEGSSEKSVGAGLEALIRGKLELTDTCWTLRSGEQAYFIALPKGTVTFLGDDGTLGVQMAGGTRLYAGQEIVRAGGYFTELESTNEQLAELVAACPTVESSPETPQGTWEIAVPNGYK